MNAKFLIAIVWFAACAAFGANTAAPETTIESAIMPISISRRTGGEALERARRRAAKGSGAVVSDMGVLPRLLWDARAHVSAAEWTGVGGARSGALVWGRDRPLYGPSPAVRARGYSQAPGLMGLSWAHVSWFAISGVAFCTQPL
ncbi:hypothetical protein Sme01_31270 [Sphaerisporangium melleum]|uniref:Secreted protein n=1 Tax=Sphaerisporangium melleum TaxID=321316 RepID=A0A917VKZ8_9ACTN|nr:hypothetical protein GCM10007964_42690 [Sphaerisporangium melleum]GII70651.1 hypothetical protein Sme01_31270 [Sphaerisporangium melleum]